MNRQKLVYALMIIAGIVLALALFAAGALWRSRAGSRRGPLLKNAEGVAIGLIIVGEKS